MTGFIIALLLLGLYWTLLYRGVSLAVFTGVTAAVVVALAATGLIGPVGFVITALVLGLGLALFNIVPLRRRVLTHRLYGIFRKILPEMGQTEQQALEAGDVWWEAELFRGRPDWQQLLDFQLTRLSEREQAFLDNETEQLCTMLDDWQVNFELKDLPEEAWEYIRNAGFLSMLIPKEHGGLGFSAYGQSCVVAKIATRSIAAAVTVMVPNSLGPGELLVHYGTKEQQDKWLPGLASGRELPCFALTGVEVGSDAAKMPDTGLVCKRSVDGEEAGAVGYLIGEENRGLACMFTMMNNARLGVGAQGLAIAERAYQQALDYAEQRKQGRHPGMNAEQHVAIIEHADVRRSLMLMRSMTEAARGLIYLNAASIDRAHRETDEAKRKDAKALVELLTPLSKSWCTDIGCEVASMGVQIHGGMGLMADLPLERIWRDARVERIWEGTSEIQRHIIARDLLRPYWR